MEREDRKGNVNHLQSRSAEAGEWQENQWQKMKSSQLGKPNTRQGEQEKETAAETDRVQNKEREKTEKGRRREERRGATCL